MNSDILPFQLGMQYENWEFDLEPIDSRIKGYDSYIYIKEITVLGIKPRKIELVFYWEILVTIILDFNDSDLLKVEKLSKQKFVRINNCYIKSF